MEKQIKIALSGISQCETQKCERKGNYAYTGWVAARVKRALSAEEVANLSLGAAHYVENALRHAESLGS